MNSGQMVFFALALTLGGVFMWVLFVSIPQGLRLALTVRLAEQRDALDQIERATPGSLQQDEVRVVDHFLLNAITGSHTFGLSSALAFMTAMPRIRRDADAMEGRTPFRGLNRDDQLLMANIESRSLRLLFCRAFLGSCLWFLVWPACFWAFHEFPGESGTRREGWRPNDLFPSVESAVEVLDTSRSRKASTLLGAGF